MAISEAIPGREGDIRSRLAHFCRETATVLVSPVARTIALYVLASLFVIELAILVPSIADRRAELVEALDARNQYAASAITRAEPPDGWLRAIADLPEVAGIAFHEGNGERIAALGDAPADLPAPAQAPRLDGHHIVTRWQIGDGQDAAIAAVQLDGSHVVPTLWQFGLRILGLVFLIAICVAAVSMTIAGQRVLHPLQRITEAVREARRSGRRDYVDPRQPGEFAELVAEYNATIAEQHAAERRGERLYYQAMHDPLTGLPNRSLLGDRLAQALERARLYGESAAVLLLDLDRFKLFNDTHGHAAGDELLRAIAERFRTTLTHVDTIARIGGDEFAIIQPKMEHSSECEHLTQGIHRCLREPFDAGGISTLLTASIGVTMLPADGTDRDTLIVNADLAMYRAKGAGGDRTSRFSPPIRDAMVRRVTLEHALRRALAESQFELHYQPLHEVKTGQVVSYEALVRWRHPQWGLVRPDHFLPVVEEVGMIPALGGWVLRQALTDLEALRSATPACKQVAVNVSALQLASTDADELVSQALAHTGRRASELALEITESAILESPEPTIAGLQRAQALGVTIAIDDFGTGYSSLAQVQDLPGDSLKIDRRFVDPLSESTKARTLLSAIVSMGHTLGMEVVAEGIESPQQLEIVRACGCDVAQGFYLGRPEPVSTRTNTLVDSQVSG